MVNNSGFGSASPQQIKIRVLLPLYGSSVGRTDITIERLDGKSFELQPLGYRPNDGQAKGVGQWYLKCGVPVKIQVRIQTTLNQFWLRDDIQVNYSAATPLELGLGMVVDSDVFLVMRGTISVPLTFYNDINQDQPIRQLWITNEIEGLSSLIVESTGLYLQGKLPDEFYLGEKPLPVTLRVPQTQADQAHENNKKNNILSQSFPDLIFDDTRFWTLNTQKIDGNYSADTITKKYAKRIEKFRLLSPEKRQMDTFIDNIDSLPGTNCIIQFFREKSNQDSRGEFVTKINWIGQSLNTRMTIGGGIAAEASFEAPFMTGCLQHQRETGEANWKLEFIQFESPRTNKTADIILTLRQQPEEEEEVQLKFAETQVQALSIPTISLRDNKYRSWLCITSGWLAIDSSKKQAEIDPEINTQGAIFGIIEIDKLLQGLQTKSTDDDAESSATGLQLQVATLQNSRVAVKLSFQNNQETLSLEINNSMITAITPNVWFNLQLADSMTQVLENPSFIPSLMMGIDKKSEENKLIETLLQKRLVTSVFVSSNVVKSNFDENRPSNRKSQLSGVPVVAKISWQETGFRFKFQHGEILDKPEPQYQYLLLWNRPIDYPIVQSFSLSPTKENSDFLECDRGLIPYQPQSENLIAIQFPKTGLPQCLPKSPDLLNPSPWQIVTSLLTSKYFLPTLPGIELSLDGERIQWVYRHSVPVLDEAYAEVSESQSETLANTGNVEGKDFTRVVGTEAFPIVPSSLSQKALGWMHKTSSNPDGAIEIEISGDDTNLLEQFKGRFPNFDLTLKNNGHNITRKFSRDENTGGLKVPLKTAITSSSDPKKLPKITVALANDTPITGNYLPYPSIINNGQPLVAGYVNADIKKVVTLDAEGLVQAETVDEYTTYSILNQEEKRRITKSFTLRSELCLEVIGVPLGKFSPESDLYQQSWMLHDGAAGWAKLAGFPLYPLCLREISESNGNFNILIEAIWLYTQPLQDNDFKPNNATGKINLAFSGNEDKWELQVTGEIDWRFSQEKADAEKPYLVRLQAQLQPQELNQVDEFEFKNLQLTIAHSVGLISLKAIPVAICHINSGVLKFEVGETRQDNFKFQIGEFSINESSLRENQDLQLIDNYSFKWLDPNAQENELIVGETLHIPGKIGNVEAIISLVRRDADFHNEFGLFRVDDSQGRIGILNPGDANYAQMALSNERRLATFPADVQQEQIAVNFQAGQWVGMYLIQNNNSENFLTTNPQNSINKRPIAFFSFINANPDLRKHVGSELTDYGVKLFWEDRESGIDSDFNDLLVNIKFKNLAFTNVIWELKSEPDIENKPRWILGIRRANKQLVALPLEQNLVGSAKFIFAVMNQDIKELLPFAEKSWFKRLEKDGGLVVVEFNVSPQGIPIIKTMSADLQLYLTNKQDDENQKNTRLVLRLKFSLENSQSSKTLEIEASGYIFLNNILGFRNSVNNTEWQHTIKFYFDCVNIPGTAIFKILSGEGGTEVVAIAGIAHHTFTDGGDTKKVEWQSPQTLRFMTVEGFSTKFLGIYKPRPKEFIFYETDRINPRNEEQIKVLQNILEILQKNPEDTVEIEGHSDSDGRDVVKQRVSEQRANAVRDWLIENNIEASRLAARGLSDSQPIADNSTIHGKRKNRRVEVIIHTIETPTIPADRQNNLVLESSGVFEIAQEAISLPKIASKTADIENQFVRLFLRSREIEGYEKSVKHIVRLPFAACSQNDMDLDLWSKIQLQPTDQDLTYHTFGTQRYIKTPRFSFDNHSSTFEIFQRTTQAQWLKSLQENISTQSNSFDEHKITELQPAFFDENNHISLRLPKKLGDLEWLMKLPASTQLSAVTLVIPNDLDDANTDVLTQPTVFEYPFIVEELPLTTIAESIDVQLITFINGQLQRIAHNRIKLEKPEDKEKQKPKIENWARNILRGKRQLDGAIVLIDFQEVIFIPRPLEALREDLINTPIWDLESLNQSYTTDTEIDPRCRLPKVNIINVIKDQNIDKFTFYQANIALKANNNLGLMLFDATPAISEDAKIKSIAATRFRLTPTSVEEEEKLQATDFIGKLRPARISPNSSSILSFTRWDEVSFEQSEISSNGGTSYPKINPRSIRNTSFPINNAPSAEAITVLPPLIDVVAWAARPGEIVRSLFSLNSFSTISQGNNLNYQLAESTPVSVSLRRPRAVAGSEESVSLKIEESYPLLNNQFYYARLLVTQVIGNTPVPETTNKVYPVLATTNEFYPFITSNVSSTDTFPALVYYEVKDGKTEVEPIKLYLLATRDFQLKQDKSVTVIALSSEKESPNGNNLPNLADTDIKQLLESNERHGNFDNVNFVTIDENGWSDFANGTDKLLEITSIQKQVSNISSESKSFSIVLATYRLKDNNIWEPTPLHVKKVSLLDKGSQIVAPKQSVALLVSPYHKQNEQVKLSGYGRLDDNDFSPIKPISATDKVVKWARIARLRSIERISPDILPNVISRDKTGEPYKYDLVFYGSGGELIPTQDT